MDLHIRPMRAPENDEPVVRGRPIAPPHPTATAGIKATGYPDLPVHGAKHGHGQRNYAQLFAQATSREFNPTAPGDQYWKQAPAGWQ